MTLTAPFVPNRVNSSGFILAQLANWLVLILRHVSDKFTMWVLHLTLGQTVTSKFDQNLQICWRSLEWHSSFPMREVTTSSTRWWQTTSQSCLVSSKTKLLHTSHFKQFIKHLCFILFSRNCPHHNQPLRLPHVQHGSDYCGQHWWQSWAGSNRCEWDLIYN